MTTIIIEISPYYAGWIKAWIWQKRKLRKLGVYGKMNYNWRKGVFEYCKIREYMVGDLIRKHTQFWPGCFTAMNGSTDKQLPREQQKLWNCYR